MQQGVQHLLTADPTMAGLIRRVGPFTLRELPPRFDTLARSIIYQQLSGRAAATIYNRLKRTLGVRRLSSRAILAASLEQLRGAGLSAAKAASLQDLARKTASGKVRFARLHRLTDEEVIAELTQVRGIGVWTAQMFLMFALSRPDVLPSGDLGIRQAVGKLYGLAEVPSPREVERRGQSWRPWASVACWYLWRSLDGDAALLNR